MKDILLHDNGQPHTSLRAHEAVTKRERTVVAHPVHSPDLAPSFYHLFGLVKDVLCGCHFADDTELKQSFCDVLQGKGKEFYNTGTQCLTQHWQKRVKNDGKFCEKIASKL
jgi:hypothetical protein